MEKIKKLALAVFAAMLINICILNVTAAYAAASAASTGACCDDPSAAAGDSCGCGCATSAAVCGVKPADGILIWGLSVFVIFFLVCVISTVVLHYKRKKHRRKLRGL